MEFEAAPTLLACLSYIGTAEKIKRLADITEDEWRAVAGLARDHGVIELLYHRVKSLNGVMPAALMEELREEYKRSSLKNLRLYQELSKVLRPLHEKNIPVIVLKGAYLAEMVYEDVGLRTMGDVDLLVKRDDLPRVERELLALGCAPEEKNREIAQDNYHFVYTMPKSGLMLEVHWILDSSSPFQIDADGLWERAQLATLARSPAWALSREDLLLHLCQHMSKHAYDMTVRMLCDIGEALRYFGPTLDWDQISARAQQWNICHAVYIILRLTRELLNAAAPADWLASLRPDDFNEQYLDLMQEQIFADRGIKGDMGKTHKVARMWEVKGISGKIALALERLFPSRETMSLMYPAPANSWRIYLYYPSRIKYVLGRHGGTLLRLIFGDPKRQADAQRINDITALRDWLTSG